MYKKTTQIPNIILDQYLRTLNAAELKILLVILRKTNGWIDKRTGKRKTRDRISYSQFMDKTGYSRRILTKTIQSLEIQGLINVSNQQGHILETSQARRGINLYFGFKHVHFQAPTSALLGREHVHSSAHNKTNYTKETKTKEKEEPFRFNSLKSIREIIDRIAISSVITTAQRTDMVE